MFDIVILGGRIVDGSGNPWYRGDVGIQGAKITALDRLGNAEARLRIQAADKIVAPGFIDTHVHGDLALLADPLHEPAIRQGVTTYIIGQDGVAMAPASAATLDYMRRYTAGFSGKHELTQKWSSMAEYLTCFDRRCALNVACLIPNGNVRMEVMGLETREPSADEFKQMRKIIRKAMEEGAIGISSGLDYIPSRYADTNELVEICKELAPFGGVYVTHMRSYIPAGVLEAMDEVFTIGREAKIPVHISHFNSQAELVLPKLDEARADGIDVTYDTYCYLAGSSILAMIALPEWVQEGGIDATLARLNDPAVRAELNNAVGGLRGSLDTIRLGYIEATAWRHFEGQTLDEAAKNFGGPIMDFVCEVLLASGMAVCCIAPHRQRTQEDVVELMKHPAQMAGSDGIFTGSFPHPRGYGCFARFLGHHVHGDRAWKLEEAVKHLSSHAAQRYGFKDRGFVREGMAADLVVFDPDAIADHSTYTDGKRLAGGMEHVLVNGEPVLLNGTRTPALPGRALYGCGKK